MWYPGTVPYCGIVIFITVNLYTAVYDIPPQRYIPPCGIWRYIVFFLLSRRMLITIHTWVEVWCINQNRRTYVYTYKTFFLERVWGRNIFCHYFFSGWPGWRFCVFVFESGREVITNAFTYRKREEGKQSSFKLKLQSLSHPLPDWPFILSSSRETRKEIQNKWSNNAERGNHKAKAELKVPQYEQKKKIILLFPSGYSTKKKT